jgi:hypothetical protein
VVKMAGIITLYKDTALSLELSDQAWTQSIVLPTTSVPLSGITTSSGVAGYALNTGTTTMLDVYLQPEASTGLNGTSFVSNLQIAPDVTGSPGTYGSLGSNVLIFDGEFLPSQSEPNTNTSSPSITNPNSAPTVSAVGSSTNLGAGTYKVAYSFKNASGETLISPLATITISAGDLIRVSSISLTTNATGVNYYLSPVPGRTEVYLAATNSGGENTDLTSVRGFVKFWARQQVGSSDPTGVYQAQLTISAVDIGQ